MKYGVLLFLLLIPFVIAQTPAQVPIAYYVNDHAHIFTEQEIADMETILSEMNYANVAQMAVVTVDNLDGQDIESFSLALSQGVLGDKEKNNGLLLLISVQDRAYRFEVGRGLESQLNDAKVGRIGRAYLVPAFREQKYGEGTLAAIYTIRAQLMNDTQSEFIDIPVQQSHFPYEYIFIFIIIGFFIIKVILAIVRVKNIVSVEKNKDTYFAGAYALSELLKNSKGKGGFGGFLGGGGFSGGGGSFGGGGSSGGW